MVDEVGSMLLYWALKNDRFNDGSVFRLLLLEHGADIKLQDEEGWAPLYGASFSGALEVVRLLLEHGADVDTKNNNGMTALQRAAEEGHDKAMKLLREHGAE